MPKTVDEQIDEAVEDLGVLFDGLDNPRSLVEKIVKRLDDEEFAGLADYAVRLVA